MKAMGEFIGIAFQIKDDLFDLMPGNKTGKPAGNDIREKKITLPLIYALHQVSSTEKKQILKIISSKSPSKTQLKTVIDFVEKNGGFEYAAKRMDEYKMKAVEILMSFPENPAQKALLEFVDYVTSRDK